MMNNVKEISRRTLFHKSEGNYGVNVTSIDAEIIVEDNGTPVYLHAEWVDAVGEIEYSACRKSICDYNEKLNAILEGEDDGSFEQIVDERNRVEEADRVDFEQYRKEFKAKLKRMILEEMEAHDIEAES